MKKKYRNVFFSNSCTSAVTPFTVKLEEDP